MRKRLLIMAVSFITVLSVNSNSFAQAEFETGKIYVYTSSYGRIEIYAPNSNQQQIERFSFLVSGEANQVFDYWNDLQILSGPELVASPTLSDFELTFSSDNTYNNPALPPDIKLDVNIYGWNNQGFVIIKGLVKNIGSTTLNSHIGGEIISYIDAAYGFETNKYDAATKIIYMYRSPSSTYTGFKILTEDLQTVKSIDWYDGYNSSDADLYTWMTTGTLESEYTTQSADGTVIFYSGAARELQPNQSITVYLIVAVGSDETTMKANFSAAEAIYNSVFTSVEQIDQIIPNVYTLSQNYPNPFNPTTKIEFSLPESGFTTLKIYNTLGQEVADLVNKNLDKGNYKVDFNGSNLSSGIYLYTITSGSYSQTKKMLLMK